MVPRITTGVPHALGELGPHLGVGKVRLLENVHQLIQALKEQ
jgi:hypothetical protein